jgi:hypothetical protein
VSRHHRNLAAQPISVAALPALRSFRQLRPFTSTHAKAKQNAPHDEIVTVSKTMSVT